MEFAIETRDLTKYYGSTTAVYKLNLKVQKGTIHGLVGENGAGKTTTLKTLAGITQPSSGTIKILGKPMVKHSWPIFQSIPLEVRKQIAYLPENPSAYNTMTVDEFMKFIGKLYKVPSNLLEKRIDKYVEFFEIRPYQESYIGTLSKGQLQRMLICSIMIREPAIMLLDEPFYALDPRAAWKLKGLLMNGRKVGRTVLLATHVLDTAEKLCDRITILNNGTAIAEGSLDELKKELGQKLSLEEIYLKLTMETQNI